MFSPITTLYTYFPLQFFICLTIDLSIMVLGVFLAIKLRKKRCFDKSQTVACIILFIWSAVILFLTVLGRRYHAGYYTVNLKLFSSYQKIFVEHNRAILLSVIQNIVLFIPIGFTLSVVFNKHRFIIPLAISFSLSLLIETCQLLLNSGYFELDDLFNNTFGGIIGIILCLIVSLILNNIQKHRKEVSLESKDNR